MTTSSKSVRVELIIDKSSAFRIAKQVFHKNKKTNQCHINAHNVNVIITYTGKRDLESIEAGMKILRHIKK